MSSGISNGSSRGLSHVRSNVQRHGVTILCAEVADAEQRTKRCALPNKQQRRRGGRGSTRTGSFTVTWVLPAGGRSGLYAYSNVASTAAGRRGVHAAQPMPATTAVSRTISLCCRIRHLLWPAPLRVRLTQQPERAQCWLQRGSKNTLDSSNLVKLQVVKEDKLKPKRLKPTAVANRQSWERGGFRGGGARFEEEEAR